VSLPADAPPARLLDALDRARRDLSRASGVDPEVTVFRVQDDVWRLTVTFPDGWVAGFEVLLDASDETLVKVADGLQDAFVENTRMPVPLCPGHQHPMRADHGGGCRGWFCPSEGTWRMAIGGYPSPGRDLRP
jgi:hypothetical protein